MGYSAEHTAAVREQILKSAARLFRSKGFAEASIDEIMSGAGLTRGGFYQHFRSKQDLFAHVLRQQMDFVHQIRRAREADPSDPSSALRAVEHYLQPGNRERVARGCACVANAGDVGRSRAVVKAAFADAFEELVDEFETLCATTTDDSRQHALAAIATCVGGVYLARALGRSELADGLLEGCRESVLRELGYSGFPG